MLNWRLKRYMSLYIHVHARETIKHRPTQHKLSKSSQRVNRSYEITFSWWQVTPHHIRSVPSQSTISRKVKYVAQWYTINPKQLTTQHDNATTVFSHLMAKKQGGLVLHRVHLLRHIMLWNRGQINQQSFTPTTHYVIYMVARKSTAAI